MIKFIIPLDEDTFNGLVAMIKISAKASDRANIDAAAKTGCFL